VPTKEPRGGLQHLICNVANQQVLFFTVIQLYTAIVHGNTISIKALDGPLHSLNAIWRFEPRDENHTQVHFSVDYEFRNPVLAAVASRVFSRMFGEILDAFERRAIQLFPDRNSACATRTRR
jgi:ribosome-associated toxin RatA of RatAB toxin-antitoxin module